MRIFGTHFWIMVAFLRALLIDISGNIYTNQWAVQILTGSQSADEVAERNGFKNLGKIGSLKDYYLFEHKRVRKRSLFLSGDKLSLLKEDTKVVWCQQQRVKHRMKRSPNKLKFSDPLWPRMWYLNRKGESMNVIGAWMQGYTGKGTVVAILDDGIEHNHTDLVGNYDPRASYDLIDNDSDPMPSYDSPTDNNHGTRCAGEVAAVANNRKCMVGVAFEANIGGVRILEGDGDVTDAMEAKAFGFMTNYIDIYSASWGPEDNGEVVDGPDRLAKEALLYGVTEGRNGKGSIYIWASGNGGSLYDSCSCDGYASSLYTFSVGGVTENGRRPWYLEECSSTLATTYSSGDVHKERKIMTIDLFNHCGEHSGTSSSAAMAAGICALALQANPNLTWRDMQYIVILTARKSPLKDAVWIKNGVGRLVSHGFGYGLMDGLAMVKLAEKWVTVPEWHSCSTAYQFIDQNFTDFLEANMSTSACWNTTNEVNYLEHVEALVWLRSSQRGNVQISLVSPNNTTSILLPKREKDLNPGHFKNWTFMSVFYWGENPHGDWKLIVKNVGKTDHEGVLHGWQLKFHGTKTYPINVTEYLITINETYLEDTTLDSDSLGDESTSNPLEVDVNGGNFTLEGNETTLCHKECLDNMCFGPSRYNCSSCKNFVLPDRACVSSCPNSSYSNLTELCIPCPHPCYGCLLEDENIRCTSCRSPFYYQLIVNESSCVQSCASGMYPDARSLKCFPCMENCKECSDSNTCLECMEGYELLSHHCYIPCNESEFRSDNNSCLPCHESCRTCSGAGISECVTCAPDRLWEGDLCVLNCSQGFYFEDSNKKLPICEMCHISCYGCVGPKVSDCTSCTNSLNFYNNTCVEKCPTTFYSSQEGMCLPCTINCLTCTGPMESDCMECLKPWVLHEGLCLKSCPSNSYYVDVHLYTNKVINKCYPCHQTCETCIGASGMQCTSCKQGLFYAYGQCVNKCTSREYESQGKCLKCHRSCLTCFGPTVDQCVECSSDMYQLHNSCLSSCPDAYYPSGNQCLRCGDGCRTCLSFISNFCTSCFNGESPQNGKCKEFLVPCSINHFYNEAFMECQPCYANCAECKGPHPGDCVRCLSSHVAHPTTSLCLPCCSNSVSHACCNCEINSGVCHEFVGEARSSTPGYDHEHVTTRETMFQTSDSMTKALSTSIITEDIFYSTESSTQIYQTSFSISSHSFTTPHKSKSPLTTETFKPPREPISFFSIVLSTCLALLVILALACVVAFCVFQAKAHNKLCWSEQQYQSVPLWHISDLKNKKVNLNDRNPPPVNV